jgi:oxalate decarboxylase
VPIPGADTVGSAQGKVPLDMAFRLMQQEPTRSPGGRVRIADMRNFTISSDVAAAICARCIGIPMPTSGNTTSPARRA